MKIIAKTANGLLIDATEDEMANLCAFWSAWNRERTGHRKFEPGMEINVSRMYQALSKIADQRDEVLKAQAILRTAAESLNLPNPILEEFNNEIAPHKAS